MSATIFAAPLDLEKNELRNAVVHPTGTAPSSPAAGQIYYDTDDGNVYVWDGIASGWVDLTQQTGGVTYAAPTATINAGDAAAAGVATSVLRSDAQFAVATGAASTISATSTNTEGSSTSLARADHTHVISTGTASTISGSNATGTSANLARADHDHALGTNVVTTTTINANAVTPAKISNVSTDDFSFPRDISVVRHALLTATSFVQLGTTATDVAIKKDANAVLGVRTGNDGAYASLKALNLTATTAIDVNGTAVALTNDSRFHTQNTDTGTTSSTFTLVGTGVNDIRLKKNGNQRLDIRVGDDTAWAQVQTGTLTVNGDLTVTGTTTAINSNTLSVGDNLIELNNDVTTTAGSTEDAGITIRRYATGDVRQDSQFIWSESSDRWQATFPASSGTATVTKTAALKHVETLGAVTANTAVTITHGLNTQDVQVTIRRASDNAMVNALTVANAVNTVQVTFSQAAAASAYIVTIVG